MIYTPPNQDRHERHAGAVKENNMECPICNGENLSDFPLCSACAPLRHFTNRTDCKCVSCADPEYFPAAVRARFPGLVLVATSSDPPELRRVEFSMDAIKPERRLAIAQGLSELVKDLVRAA